MAYHCEYHNFEGHKGGLRTGKEQQTLYAQSAAVAYGRNKEARTKMSKKMKGFNIDWNYSNDDMVTLINGPTKELIFACRGTDITLKNKRGLRDLKDDAFIALGVNKMSVRVKKLKKIVKKAMSSYKGYDIVFTGHSLGGNIAKHIADKLKKPAVVFNMGSSITNSNPLTAAYNKLFKKQTKAIHYTTGTDPISISEKVFGNSKTVVVKKKKGISTHALKNFTGDGKRANKWLIHVNTVRYANPGKSYKQCLQLAKNSYQKV